MEVSGKGHTNFVGDELSILKLGSVLVGLTGSVYLENQHSQIADFEVKCVFWPVEVVPGQIHT